MTKISSYLNALLPWTVERGLRFQGSYQVLIIGTGFYIFGRVLEVIIRNLYVLDNQQVRPNKDAERLNHLFSVGTPFIHFLCASDKSCKELD